MTRVRRAVFGRLWTWVAEGFEAFDASPGRWAQLVLLSAALVLFLYSAPWIGPGLAAMGITVITASMLLSCDDLTNGEAVGLNPLGALGRVHAGTLLTLGALHAGIAYGAGIGGRALLAAMQPETAAHVDLSNWFFVVPSWALVVAFVAILVVELGLGFAAAAAVLSSAGPLEALGFALRVFARNPHILVVFGLVLGLVMLAGFIGLLVGALVALPATAGALYASLAELTEP